MLITSKHDYMEVLLDVTPDDGDDPEFKPQAETKKRKKLEIPVAKGGQLTITSTCEEFPEFVVEFGNSAAGHSKHEGSKTKPFVLKMPHEAAAEHQFSVTYKRKSDGKSGGKNGGKTGGKNNGDPIEFTAMAYPCGPCPR
jgi:hypothetical protein